MRRGAIVILLTASLAVPGVAWAGPNAGGTKAEKAAGGAAAEAWGVTEADAAVLAAQAPAVDAAEELRDAVADLPGFTSIGLADDAIVVRWKGKLPAMAASAVESARRAVEVRVESAAYSRTEMLDAASKITWEIEAGRGNGVHSVAVPGDGSGLRLSVDPGTSAAADRTLHAAGVSVASSVTAEERVRPFSRENDFAPWAGGSVVANSQSGSIYSGRRCTAGWSVKDASGRPYLLTASHCGAQGDLFRDPTGEWIGRVALRDHDRDVELVSVSSAAGEIYVGGPIGATQAIKGVAGWAAPFYNESICQSGAYSGNICGLVIEDVEDIKCDIEPNGQWKCWGPLLRARRTNGAVAGLPGDSGGPVYVPFGSRVKAVGTITGGNGGNLLWFVTITAAIDKWNVNILTRSF